MSEEDHDLLVAMNVKVEEMHKALMGNGKPGLITDVTRLKAQAALERWLGGALVVAVLAALGYIAAGMH